MWDNHLYFAGTVYRSAHLGAPLPNAGVDASGAPLTFNIRGVAPYWRVAWQQTRKNSYLEVGSYGIHMKSTPGGLAAGVTGPEDGYTDWAADFQFDQTIPQFRGDVLSIRGTYIRENSSLLATFMNGGAASVQHHLNTVQANAEYHFGDKYSATFGYFNVTGTPDLLLFPTVPVTGNANGDPRNSGFIGNISWWPVQNIGLTLQYTGYTRFNGAGM